jgi:enoyl-CoA hydratase/carnithine racemase
MLSAGCVKNSTRLNGMIPSMGAIQKLRLIVGMSRAKELILTGKTIEASEARG